MQHLYLSSRDCIGVCEGTSEDGPLRLNSAGGVGRGGFGKGGVSGWWRGER